MQCLAEAVWAGHTGLTALLAAAGGHAGYEMAPFIPSLEAVIVALLRCIHPAAKQLSGALNTVQHHDLHHRFPTRHFSLYFTHWDRWCGTEHSAYCEQVGACLYPVALLVMASHTGHVITTTNKGVLAVYYSAVILSVSTYKLAVV